MKSSCGGGGGGKMDRKMIEKKRRIQMKNLCLKLSSLIPKDYYNTRKNVLTQQDYFEEAASYIQNLREKIKNLKQRRDLRASIKGISKEISNGVTIGTKLPLIEIRHQDTILEVVLISSLNKRFKLHEVISILQEEGAEVVNASFAVIDNKIHYTIHSQALYSRIGLDAARVFKRLNELVP
ncbi:transcription factor bHLH168-like [Typha angustifolia]|uniref:transcription factor bHLH168-like n=1 Tax=Typha angustifolia TaxID=59011 RepID=UPI003C2E2302